MGRVPTEQLRRAQNQLTASSRRGLHSKRQPQQPSHRPARVASNSVVRRKDTRNNFWSWHWDHSYLMVAFAFVVAATCALLHALDLVFAWPFHRVTPVYDLVTVVCAVTVALLCIPVYRDLGRFA